MFPVTPAFCRCLVWLVTERGGEGDCVIRWQINNDKLWSKVTENERKDRESKAERDSLTYSPFGLFRLVSLTFALPADTMNPWLPRPPTPTFAHLCAAMEVLVSELGVLLKMLDQESLSSSTQEKKTSVWNLLQQIQPSGQWDLVLSVFYLDPHNKNVHSTF